MQNSVSNAETLLIKILYAKNAMLHFNQMLNFVQNVEQKDNRNKKIKYKLITPKKQ